MGCFMKRIYRYLERNRNAVRSLLKELIRIPTVNPPGKHYAEMVDFLEERCRKLGMENGQVFINFLGEIQKTVALAKKIGGLAEMATEVEKAANRLGEVAMHLGTTAMSEKFKVAFAAAFPFLEVMGDIIMAWMLLWRAALAKQKLDDGAKKKDRDFYEGQLKTADFFIQTQLPASFGKMDGILKSNDSAIEISDAAFGG